MDVSLLNFQSLGSPRHFYLLSASTLGLEKQEEKEKLPEDIAA
jgi:hypothetical protein